MSEITNHIEGITGVSTANTDFIESAQRFAASKIPKELMLWAITETVPGTHGGNNSNQQITLPVKSDSLIFVRRDQFEAQKVNGNMRGFIGNSNSLYKATNTFPKYYIADGNRVIIKPDPDDTYTGHAQYVDYTKINEDSDLRNAVVFHASSQEFEKIATGKTVDWSDLVLPIAPSLSDSSISFNTTAPSYTQPVSPARTAFNDYWELGDFGDSDPGVLSISATPPVPPVINAESSSTGGAEVDTAKLATAPTYIPPVMSAPDFDDASTNWITTEEDPEMVSSRMQVINGQIGDFSARVQNSLNTFNKENAEYQAKLQIALQDAAQANSGDSALINKFSSDLGTYQANVSKEVQEYQQKLSRYQLELGVVQQSWAKEETDKLQKYQADIQNELNNFNESNTEYQAQLQISIQDAQLSSQDDAQKLQKYSQELQSYVSEVNQKSQKIASATQNATYYSNESKKYYEWAITEVNTYIQNNSKMIRQTMAAQQQAAQQQAR